jgi:ParB family chromosome partitioning protein
MTRRSGLGRGLEALIPGAQPAVSMAGAQQVDVEAISPNPRQPRSPFNEAELLKLAADLRHRNPEQIGQLADDLRKSGKGVLADLVELAASIREHGVLQPLIVTQDAQPEKFTLVAGERRLRAARLAGLEQAPVLVREASDQQRLELALIENLQRADLNPLETAEAYRQLADDFHLTHEEIADRVGKSRPAVSNTLRLLDLAPSVLAALAAGQISEGHARPLLALPTPQAQANALHSILRNHLNVRQTEDLVRRLLGQAPVAAPRPAPLPELTALEERLRASLGTKVNLSRGRKGGVITIYYYSDEELENLVDRLVQDSE